ncbi:GroES-like protein [Hypoxylon sp. FL1150]|nr:GroES-like protein [Hypoxylon sp. FL1150]
MTETSAPLSPVGDSGKDCSEKLVSITSEISASEPSAEPSEYCSDYETHASQSYSVISQEASGDRPTKHDEAFVPSTQWGVISPLVGEKLGLHYQQIPVRSPELGEVIVRIAWTGICRSDVSFSKGPSPGLPAYNHIAGHEGIGHVVQSADPSRIGLPVGIRYIGHTCGFCSHCRAGLPEQCARQMNSPKHYNGTFQQFMTVPWSCLVPLPEWVFDPHGGISPAIYTAAMCSGAAALKAVRAAGIRAGDVVVINGIAGGIGHLAGQIAKNVRGAKVIGLDLGWKIESLAPERSSSFCDHILATPNSSDLTSSKFLHALEEICSSLRGRPIERRLADTVINCASTEEQQFTGLENIARDGGVVVYCGVPRTDLELSVTLHNLVERQLTIKGTLMGGPDVTYEVLEYIKQGRIKPVTTEINLDEVPQGMQDLLDCKGIGKLVVKVNGPLASRVEAGTLSI